DCRARGRDKTWRTGTAGRSRSILATPRGMTPNPIARPASTCKGFLRRRGAEERMPKLDVILEELVTANRILAREGVVDSFGHVSIRHPDHPDRFLLSRARAPDCIEASDFITFALDGTPLDAGDRKPYLERFIHGAC